MGDRRRVLNKWIIVFFLVMSFFTYLAIQPAKVIVKKEAQPREIDTVRYTIPEELQLVIDKYDHWIKNQVDSGISPGAAVAIVKDDHVLLARGYGLKDYNSTDSINEHTVFRIASVSKGFASVLAGILVEDSLVQWHDKVNGHLPSFALKDTLNSNDLEIAHILSHTTGLPRHAYTDLIESGSEYNDMLEDIQQLDLIGPVGKYYSYQNVIYSLFSDIATSVTEIPYDQLMHKMIFDPVGMVDASVSYDSIMNSENVALPHVRTKKGWRPTKISSTYYNVIPAAGVNASVSDMAQWLITLMGQKPDIITQSTLDTLFTPIVQTPRRRYLRNWPQLQSAYYGLGWRIFNYGEKKIIYHGGYVNHYRAEIGFDPEENVGIVVLTNAPSQVANQGIATFFNAYFENNGL